MGISCSCPFSEDIDLESGLESILVRSISFGADEVKTTARSISFNGRESSQPAVLKSVVSGKMVVEGSISFKRRETETVICITPPSPGKQNKPVIRSIRNRMTGLQNQTSGSEAFNRVESPSPTAAPQDSKHEAALKLQKVYKSFRTRRKLADCAVLVEQSWWKVLDFAELKRNSVSFFEIEKSETAISRWSRARTKAAKVGKGLSKNERAQKLALQHWLEAIDPRHRYGHNLQFYYNKWLECQSRQPFFYWLDIGEGKEENLVEACPRSKLQHQCIKYLGPMEREMYEVIVKDGKFFYKQKEELLNTSGELEDIKWIFVLSTSKSLYVGQKMKGKFQHSSFLAGGATSAAGRLVVENGTLKAVWPHSGHYRPTEENFKDFVSFLEENNVDLTDVKMGLVDDEQEVLNKQKSSVGLVSNFSDEDLTQTVTVSQTQDQSSQEKTREEETLTTSLDRSSSRKLLHYCRQLKSLVIPKKDEVILESLDAEDESPRSPAQTINAGEQDEDEIAETVPEEKILQRINSHKGMKSYQLGRQLSCKWSSGAGPRIGCVRDYPSELQTHALEKVSLSPRSERLSKQHPSSPSIIGLSPSGSPTTRCSYETGVLFNKENPLLQSSKPQCSPLSRGEPIAAAAT
uniref:IQ domain-containing protein IQM2-like n=1 Tax=Kalanchoe fedtschenkoi TaxID=63787 RepID=A0A7N0TH92_KALFE